ncbi:MAG: pilus assembly protein PilA [Bdellovibrionaceae bacterium]|nr:pilus assembly protein PilA [Pseudobdellovibrionaceae bacterium]
MVVVAIIGILSAIAIPSINKYMAKARQSEAKTNLASIYTANKAFFAEFNIYDSRFETIGYRPEGKMRYNVGFQTSPVCPVINFGYPRNPTATAAQNSVSVCTVGSAIPTNGSCVVLADGNQTITGDTVNCNSGAAAFTAASAGRIASSTNNIDRWTINNNKVLANTSDGTQ